MVAGEDAVRQFLLSYTTDGDIWRSPFFFSPTLLLLYIAIIYLYSSYRAPYQPDNTLNTQNRNSKLLFKLVFSFSCLISLTLLTDIMVIIARLMKEKMLTPVLGYYSSISFIIWISNTYYLMKKANKFSMWQTFQSSFYGLTIIGETMIGWLWLMAMMQSGQSSVSSIYDKCLLSTFTIRYALEISITIFSVIHKFTNRRREEEGQSETSHLISSSTRTETYGSTIITTTTVYSSDNSISTKLLTTLPFIWPDDNFELQARLIICIFLMLAGVAINVLTPIQVGYVVDHLEGGSGKFAWAAVLAYAGLRYFQGGAGVLKTIQNQTWEPVEEHLLTEISTELKEYLKGLSSEERAYMKMDEAQKTIFKGAKCIIQLLSQVSFHIFPLLTTMAVSITVLGAGYTFLGGLIVFVTMVTYTYLTIIITEKQIAKNGQKKASAALGLAQNSIISTGVLVGSLWYAWQISRNKLTSGDFVVFNMYILQLGTPLRFLGNFYQMTQKSFKDLGDMSMLFTNKETSTSIQEVAGPSTTDPSDAHIVFDRVQFGYDGERDIFKNLSFTVKKDAFVAVVGPSGCGKSTLMRLIFRFYDPLSGKIYVNGKDSKHIEQSILRQNIGFIPQSTILFNDTVLYNIRHGNIDASDEDVFHAAQVAQVHNQILKFPQGYSTRLGERGYKISDSVKQRIAIARAVLKNPNLLLLDEATSALGAEREKDIQKGLADFSDNCTVFFATRRLSSIVEADVILVMKDGQLMECGTHKELLERASRNNTPSIYSNMWQKQVQSSNSTCQDSKNDNMLRVVEDNNSEQEPPISRNVEISESSTSNNKFGYSSKTPAILNSVELSDSKIPDGCTTSFPTFTKSTITTHTDFNVSKSSQFYIPISGKNNLPMLFDKYDFSDFIFKNHSNITDEVHNPLRPTKPLLLEPSSSLSPSNPGELIIPKLLESDMDQFDKLITLESGEYRPPCTTRCTTTDQTIHNNANADRISYSTDTSSDDSNPANSYTGNTSKLALNEHYSSITGEVYNNSQFTMPTRVMPKYSHITSNTAELVLPIFSESSLKKFSKNKVDKSREELISVENTFTELHSTQLSEAHKINGPQNLTPKENVTNTINSNRVDINIDEIQDIPPNMRLSKSKLTVPTNMISSKHGEMSIPGFSDSTFSRLDKAIVNKPSDTSPSKIQKTNSINNNGTLSVQKPSWKKHNNKEDIKPSISNDSEDTIRPATPELLEPTSSLISSHTAELIVPKFSDSKLKQFSKPIVGTSCAPLTFENTERSTVNSGKNESEAASSSHKYTHDRSIGGSNMLQNPCGFIQSRTSSLADSKQNTDNSHVAELSIPEFSSSKLNQLNASITAEHSTSTSSVRINISTENVHIEEPKVTHTFRAHTYNGSEHENFVNQLPCDPNQLTVPSVANSKQSIVCPNSAELSVPAFSNLNLERFSEPNTGDILKPSSSENMGSSTTHEHREASGETSILILHKYKRAKRDRTSMRLVYDPIQLFIPCLGKLRQSSICFGSAELSTPKLPELTITQLNQNNITESSKASSSRDITSIRTVNSSTHKSPARGIQQRISVEHSYQSQDPSIIHSPIQLSKQHFKTSEQQRKSSNLADLVISIFSTSYLKRYSKIGMNDHDGHVPSVDTPNNVETIPVHTDVVNGLNNSSSNAYRHAPQTSTIHFELFTSDLKEPATILTCSSDAELVVPLFSRSLATRVRKLEAAKLNTVGSPEIHENECSISTSSKPNDLSNATTVSYNSNKGKNVAISEVLPTESDRIGESLKLDIHASGQRHIIKKDVLNTHNDMTFDATKTISLHKEEKESIETITITSGSRPSSHPKSKSEVPTEELMFGDNEPKLYANMGPATLNHTIITSHCDFKTNVDLYTYLYKHCLSKPISQDSTTFENSNKEDLSSSDDHAYTSPSCYKTNNKSLIHSKNGHPLESDNPETIQSRLLQCSVSNETNVDLNKTTPVHKTEQRETSNQNLAKTHAITTNVIATECKEPNQSNSAINQRQNLSDKKKDMYTEPNSISSADNDQEDSEAQLAKEEIPKVCGPTVHSLPKVYKVKDCLNPKYKISRHSPNLDCVVSTDSVEKASDEFNKEQCHQQVTSTSTSPRTTTVVQLEISKTAEFSTAKLQKNDISSYVKSEKKYSTNTPPPRDSKLRQRQVFKQDSVEISGTSAIKSKKNGSTSDCVIGINRETERLEKSNGQPHDGSTKAQNNKDALKLQTGNRNWKQRLRRAFPAPVLTNDYFVSANARLYLPRSGDPSDLDTNVRSSISHLLHLYENDIVSDDKMDLVAPNMPKFVDASTEIQLIKSDNANFIIQAHNSLNLSKFKQKTNGGVRIPKDDYANSEQSSSKIPVLNTSSHSINNAPGPSNANNLHQSSHGSQTSHVIGDLRDEIISTPTPETNALPQIRKFNKAKHIQLYSPLIAKLISFDIATILSSCIYKKISVALQSFSTTVSKTSHTDTIVTTRDIGTPSNQTHTGIPVFNQGHTEIPVASSSEPIKNSRSFKKPCCCKRQHERKHEAVVIPLKGEVIEIILGPDAIEPYEGYQVEYVELELDSNNDEPDNRRI